MIPLAFLGVQGGALLPLWPVLFSFPVTMIVSWYRRVLLLRPRVLSARLSRLRQEAKPTRFDAQVERPFRMPSGRKGTSIADGDMAPNRDGVLATILVLIVPELALLGQHGGPQIEVQFASRKGWYRPEFPAQLKGRSIRHPGGQLCWRMASSSWPRSLCQHGPNGLANWIAMSKPIVPFKQVESARDSTPHTTIISPLRAAVQSADSSPQPWAETPPSSPPKKHARGRLRARDKKTEQPRQIAVIDWTNRRSHRKRSDPICRRSCASFVRPQTMTLTAVKHTHKAPVSVLDKVV